jgi:hypothetical protein
VGQNRAKLPKLVGMASPDDRDHEESGEYPSATEGAGPASCSTPRWPALHAKAQCTLVDQQHRVRLIADISKLLHDPCVPEPAKAAGLTLIGWLARRQPGEGAHGYGVEEAQRGRGPRRAGRR